MDDSPLSDGCCGRLKWMIDHCVICMLGVEVDESLEYQYMQHFQIEFGYLCDNIIQIFQIADLAT